VKIFAPEPRAGGRVVSGSVEEVVEELVREILPIVKGVA